MTKKYLNPRVAGPFFANGKKYENLTDLAKDAQISYGCAYKRLIRDGTDEEIFHGRRKVKAPPVLRGPDKRGNPTTVGGVTYPSLAAAFRAIKPNLSYVTVRARLLTGYSPDEALGVVHRVDGRKTRYPK